ncbi:MULTISPECIES: MFS transporter [unclassified Azospirillum]|uniref:MFS transporter n=1 Tax=unclassified Azospirillum TaxID=2630922 RepID=UPI000B63D3BE|nr:MULTISPECIES: MFS transporter [unclassified Azospirillum]SNS77107.1 Predicted arabinose efflux permease, MFS family [Azospirillum sp. RU38E]SNS94276.1 Predicted arabinose efflux permease, MFS family [Azospirillum sp. RU37A]
MQPSQSMTRQDIRTLALAALGGALEFYDFIIFVYFATVVGQLFFPPELPDWMKQLQTFGVFAAGYLARPLGGIIMAHFGDRLGRKRMFTLSILMMALSTLGMGLLPTYAQIGLAAPVALLALRLLQGAAIGGEVPGAWVFVAEHVPDHRIGLACGTVTAGLTLGILMGSLMATGLNLVYSPAEVLEFGWRIPFLLGGVFGLISVYLRRWLEETPVFKALQERKAVSADLPLRVVTRDHRSAVAISMALTGLLSAAIIVLILMTPAILQKSYGFAPAVALQANSVATFFLTIGCILAGLGIDRLGGGRFFLLASPALGIMALALFIGVAAHPGWLYPLSALCGLSVGIVGAVPYVMVRAFPAAVRFTGLSFSYNVAYAVFGGLTPIAVTLMQQASPLAPAFYVLAFALVGTVIGLVLLRGQRLG